MVNPRNKLAPNRTVASRYIDIARELVRQVDYDRQYEKQMFERYISALGYPLRLYFLRDCSFLHYSFEGFGDLLGHQLSISHDGSTIATALVGLDGDATLCLDQPWLPSNFHLAISSTPVG